MTKNQREERIAELEDLLANRVLEHGEKGRLTTLLVDYREMSALLSSYETKVESLESRIAALEAPDETEKTPEETPPPAPEEVPPQLMRFERPYSIGAISILSMVTGLSLLVYPLRDWPLLSIGLGASLVGLGMELRYERRRLGLPSANLDEPFRMERTRARPKHMEE